MLFFWTGRCAPAESATALEEGWLLAEMSERFGYDQEELARRFDRSVSWVRGGWGWSSCCRRRAAAVRSGAITAHVAMKFLVPVGAVERGRLLPHGEGFARHRLRSREAGQLYTAWRSATAAVRQRLLPDPQLFLKTQRQHEKSPAAPAMVELSRDLEVVIAMVRRGQSPSARRHGGTGSSAMRPDAGPDPSCAGRVESAGDQAPASIGDRRAALEPRATRAMKKLRTYPSRRGRC